MTLNELYLELALIENKLLTTNPRSIEYIDLMVARDQVKSSIIHALELLIDNRLTA